MTSQSDISLLLTFRAEMIDPSLPTGLWWCATPEDAAAVGINAVCKNRYAAWEDLAACTEFITSSAMCSSQHQTMQTGKRL